MCVDQIVLWVSRDYDASTSRGIDITNTMAVFLNWSSSCKMSQSRPSIHPKPYYKGLENPELTS